MNERELEELSFNNMIHYFEKELTYVLDHSRYPHWLTAGDKRRFHKYGFTTWKLHNGGIKVFLTRRAEDALLDLPYRDCT